MRSTLRVCPQCGATAAALTCPQDGWATVPMELVTGTQLAPGTLLFGRFVVGAFIESQGAIAIHEGHDGQAYRKVRIAIVPMPTGAALAEVARVQRAARELERLSHPNVAQVLATGMTERGDLAVVEACIDAPTLSEVLRLGPIGVERAITLGLSLAAGLEAAHDAALAHHDLAPTRVRVLTDGTGVMTGLGLGDLLRPLDPLADAGPTLGRAARYRAPEQTHDRLVTRHADIYSLGAVLFEAVTGMAHAERSETLATGLTGDGPILIDTIPIDRHLAEVLARCLERKPWNRYDSATRVREALEAARLRLLRKDTEEAMNLAEVAWALPVSEPATRESRRPRGGSDSGLLAATAMGGGDPFVGDHAIPPEIAPVAPIARTMVRHVPERQQGWWIIGAAAMLVLVGLALTRLKYPGRDSSAGTTLEVESALAQPRTETGGPEGGAHVRAEAEQQARAEAEERARAEAEERARAEAEESARLEIEERLWLEAEELARQDDDQKARLAAAENARLAAEEQERLEAEERERLEAEAAARFEKETLAKREAEARAEAAIKARVDATIKASRTTPVALGAAPPVRLERPARVPSRPDVARAPDEVGSAAPDPATTPAPPRLGYRRAMLVTVPEGAAVLVDGALVGRSPIALSWQAGTETPVWVMLEGHEPAGFTVSDKQDSKMLRLELVRRRP